MLDLQAVKFANVLAPISVAAAATATTNDIDCKGFRAVAAIIQAGVVAATGVATLKWQEADLIGGPYTDIPGATHTALVDADDNTILCSFINLKGRRRFLRLVLTNGITNATVMAAMAILYRAEESPDTLVERGLKEQLFV